MILVRIKIRMNILCSKRWNIYTIRTCCVWQFLQFNCIFTFDILL